MYMSISIKYKKLSPPTYIDDYESLLQLEKYDDIKELNLEGYFTKYNISNKINEILNLNDNENIEKFTRIGNQMMKYLDLDYSDTDTVSDFASLFNSVSTMHKNNAHLLFGIMYNELAENSINYHKIKPLPINLVIFNCSNNNIRELPELPLKLEELECSNNKLQKLPKLPHTLKSLICVNNELTYLPLLPPKLEKLHVELNRLKKIPVLPSTVEEINYLENPVHSIVETYFNDNLAEYHIGIRTVNMIENWFLECKYNPKYKYCRDRIKKEHEELYNV